MKGLIMSADGSGNSAASAPQQKNDGNVVKGGIVHQVGDKALTGDDFSKIDELLGIKPRESGGDRQQEEQKAKPSEAEKSKPRANDKGEDDGKPFSPESIFDGDEDEGDEARNKAVRRGSKSLEAFAEAKGFDASEILDLEIETDGNEPMTVKQALARAREIGDFQAERDAFDDKRDEQMSQLFNARAQIDTFMSKIARLVPEEVAAEMFEEEFQERHAFIARQREIAYEYMPHWRDPATREAELGEMDKFFQKMFQFKPGEIRRHMDARYLYVANFTYRMFGKYSRVREKLKGMNIPTNEPSRRGAKVDQHSQVKALASSGQRDAAVDKLLGF